MKPKAKNRWKPGIGSVYFCVSTLGGASTFKKVFFFDPHDNGNYRDHNCFKTKLAAKQAAKRVRKALKGIK